MSGGTDAVPVKVLLITVFQSIIEVVILCAAGYILARAGILDKPTQRKLNVVNVSLMTPALLFSKVAFSLTPSKLKEMWIIPLGFFIVTIVSAGVAFGLGTVFRLKKSQRAFAMCASMFQNSNSLPIALIQSLVVEVPGLKWGDDDTKDAMLGRALAYLVVYSTLGMMLRWSYGVKLLSSADEEQTDVTTEQVTNTILTEEPQTLDNPGSSEPHPAARETDPLFSSADRIKADEREETASRSSADGWKPSVGSPGINGSGNGALPISTHTLETVREGRRSSPSPNARTTSFGAAHGSGPGSRPYPRRPSQMSRAESGREFWGLPQAGQSRADQKRYGRNGTLHDHQESCGDTSDSEDEDQADSEDEEWGDRNLPYTHRRQTSAPSHTRLGAFWRRTKHRTKSILRKVNEFLTVPMYSALLSIFIALIPPLQRLLNEAKPLTQAIKSAGQCSIPLTLVVLGAFFYNPPAPAASTDKKPSSDNANGNGNFLQRKIDAIKNPRASTTHPGENRTVFVAVISRMILVPAILLPGVALVARYDSFEAAADPVFVLAAVLIISSPPALTLAQITQAASGDAFERLISKTISWSYAILTPPLTLVYVVLGLVFGRL